MTEYIGVIDWFTKNKRKVEYPQESDELLDMLIGEIIQIFNKSPKLSKVANLLFETYQKNYLLRVCLKIKLDSTIEIKCDHIRSMCTPCLLYTSPSPRDGLLSRMPSSA